MLIIAPKIKIVIGVQHVAGDMFVEIPKGDAIFMKVSII